MQVLFHFFNVLGVGFLSVYSRVGKVLTTGFAAALKSPMRESGMHWRLDTLALPFRVCPQHQGFGGALRLVKETWVYFLVAVVQVKGCVTECRHLRVFGSGQMRNQQAQRTDVSERWGSASGCGEWWWGGTGTTHGVGILHLVTFLGVVLQWEGRGLQSLRAAGLAGAADCCL